MGDKRIEFSKVRNDSGNDSSFLGDLLCCYLVYSQKKEESHSRKAKKEDDMCFDYCFCRIFYVKFSQVFGAITLVLGGGLYQIKTDFPDIQWNHFYAAFDDPQDQLMVLYGTVLWDRDNRDWF